MRFCPRLAIQSIFTFINLCYLKKKDDEMFINCEEKEKAVIEKLLIEI